MMGAPAFASTAQGPIDVGNITGNGNVSIASGNYVYEPVSDPTDTCGIALAFLGFANASCEGGAAVVDNSFNGQDGSGF